MKSVFCVFRPPFEIDPDTGDIKLKFKPRADGKGLIRFKIIASDPPIDQGPHQAMASVEVSTERS